MFDVGLVFYGGLLVLALWRALCAYHCCGLWLSFMNYASLLFMLLAISLAYSMQSFYAAIWEPLHKTYDGKVWNIIWLHDFVLAAPIVCVLTLLFCWFQSEAHIFEIRKKVGVLQHDRAVQVIMLPAVFSVMAMAAMVSMMELITGQLKDADISKAFSQDILDKLPAGLQSPSQTGMAHGLLGEFTSLHAAVDSDSHLVPDAVRGISMLQLHALTMRTAAPSASLASHPADSPRELQEFAMWRYETCFYVGDLFEAWVLYQFGCLMLDLIGVSFRSKKSSELMAAHRALTSLTWLGTSTFVLVCLAQTACSLMPYIGGSEEKRLLAMQAFQIAGFFASGAAIYNLFVVERAFHHDLAGCSPVLKFISVKLLVSLSFFQRGLILGLQALNEMLPSMAHKIVQHVPILGDIVNMTPVQARLFYPSLLLYECLFICTVHMWAWSANENWYMQDFLEEEDDGEKTAEEPVSPRSAPSLTEGAAASSSEGYRAESGSCSLS